VAPPSPLLAVLNVTAHASTASVPMIVLLYDGRCSVVYVAIKGLRYLYYCYVVTMTAGEEFVFLSLYAGLFVTFHL